MKNHYTSLFFRSNCQFGDPISLFFIACTILPYFMTQSIYFLANYNNRVGLLFEVWQHWNTWLHFSKMNTIHPRLSPTFKLLQRKSHVRRIFPPLGYDWIALEICHIYPISVRWFAQINDITHHQVNFRTEFEGKRFFSWIFERFHILLSNKNQQNSHKILIKLHLQLLLFL